ncbi:hypothetical protein D9757_002973 [Collybiopsis confluens]|uniref:Ras-domain-containing protein n=1 Tax=Collybiopsis confluens TaxID=2823264 RepID=A0A8H5HVI1_9AGAR|nr:hypothetical protein D9757_002973 [Collybiopsis confluens]
MAGNDWEDATELLETYGEAGTGKSCLLHHFTHNSFKDHSQHTIGVEFSSRTIKLGEKRIKLQLWDTAGQERFRYDYTPLIRVSSHDLRLVISSVTRSYYRGAAGAILVYDITNRESFSKLSRWLADARALGSPNLVTVLVGNKADREEDREVEWAEASRWAAENEVHFLEASSLTGDNVEAPFMLAARSILLSIESGMLDPEKAGSGFRELVWTAEERSSETQVEELGSRITLLLSSSFQFLSSSDLHAHSDTQQPATYTIACSHSTYTTTDII